MSKIPASSSRPPIVEAASKPQHRLYPRAQPTTQQSSRHHRERSNDEELRIRKGLRDPKANTLDIFSTSPEKKETRRPHARRNSDTSVMDFNAEAQKESRREKDSKDAAGRSQRKPRRNKQVDVIDKLDGTGLYGVGCEYFCLPGGYLRLHLTSCSVPS